jgi:hypothetical protein
MNHERNEERRPYVKPELRRVTLKPEESLAAGCKTPSGPGPVTNCNVGDCFNVGS